MPYEPGESERAEPGTANSTAAVAGRPSEISVGSVGITPRYSRTLRCSVATPLWGGFPSCRHCLPELRHSPKRVQGAEVIAIRSWQACESFVDNPTSLGETLPVSYLAAFQPGSDTFLWPYR